VANLQDSLTKLISPLVESMDHELVGVRYLPQGKFAVLRVYIDHEDGVSLDNCSSISHQISGVLDVEDLISGRYNLEVSSPGMDRYLFDLKHYKKFINSEIKVSFNGMIDGKRKLKGIISEVVDDQIKIAVGDKVWSVTIEQIDMAQIIPKFD